MRQPTVLLSLKQDMYNELDRRRKPASMQDYIRYILNDWIEQCRKFDGLQQSLFKTCEG